MEQGWTCYSSTSRPDPSKILHLFSHPWALSAQPEVKEWHNARGLDSWVTSWRRKNPNCIRMWHVGQVKEYCLKPQPLRTEGCLLQHFLLNTWTNTCTLKGNVIALSISGKPVFFNMYSNKYLTFKKRLFIHHLKSHL